MLCPLGRSSKRPSEVSGSILERQELSRVPGPRQEIGLQPPPTCRSSMCRYSAASAAPAEQEGQGSRLRLRSNRRALGSSIVRRIRRCIAHETHNLPGPGHIPETRPTSRYRQTTTLTQFPSGVIQEQTRENLKNGW